MKRAALWVLCVACGASGTNEVVERSEPPGAGAEPSQAPADTGADPSATGPDAAELEPALAAVLAAHDRARTEHCAPPLEWSDALAGTAAAWADELARRGCSLQHSRSAYGENLFAATAGARSPAQAVQVWVDEREAYGFDGGGFSMATGHFTQVVWKSTERLGCATRECDGLDLWVCHYDPPGNVRGGYQANVRPRGCAD